VWREMIYVRVGNTSGFSARLSRALYFIMARPPEKTLTRAIQKSSKMPPPKTWTFPPDNNKLNIPPLLNPSLYLTFTVRMITIQDLCADSNLERTVQLNLSGQGQHWSMIPYHMQVWRMRCSTYVVHISLNAFPASSIMFTGNLRTAQIYLETNLSRPLIPGDNNLQCSRKRNLGSGLLVPSLGSKWWSFW